MVHQTPVIYLCSATRTHSPWSSVSCADLSLTEHHLFTAVFLLQRRACWEAEPPAEQTEVSRQLLEAPVSVRRLGSNRWPTRTHARFRLTGNQKHSPVTRGWDSLYLAEKCSGSEVLAVRWSLTLSCERNVQVTGNSSPGSYCLFFLYVMQKNHLSLWCVSL